MRSEEEEMRGQVEEGEAGGVHGVALRGRNGGLGSSFSFSWRAVVPVSFLLFIFLYPPPFSQWLWLLSWFLLQYIIKQASLT
jgi:hypothetical protein